MYAILKTSCACHQRRIKMTMSGNSFQHEPIDGNNEIRLLTFSPTTSPDQMISCEITHHVRSACPEYEALSYTWGNLTRRKAILCNGKTLMVTESCEAALRALRDRQERSTNKSSSGLSGLTRSLSELLWESTDRAVEAPKANSKIWIDAICINQSDMVERNGQVAQMGTIFGRASQTVVFLGEFGEDAAFITKLLDAHSQSTKLKDLLARGPEIPDINGQDSSPTTPWHDFFRRHWFTRTWIIQEVMLSTKLLFLVGDRDIPWARMEMSEDAVVGIATNQRRSSPRAVAVEFPLPQIFKMREMFGVIHTETIGSSSSASNSNRSAQQYGSHSVHSNGVDWWRLFSVLKLTNRFQCRDPRDKVFAILHLFEQPIPRILAPDYSKSLGEVYTDLSWFLITCNIPEMFELAGMKQSKSLVSTWVINWSLPRDEASMTLSDFDQAKTVGTWNRSAGFKRGYKRIYARRDREVLILRGLLIKGMKLTIPADWDWKSGDEICVFLGFPKPSQIRKSGNGWRFVGCRDVPGLMNGQAVKHLDWSLADAQVPKAPLIDFRIY